MNSDVKPRPILNATCHGMLLSLLRLPARRVAFCLCVIELVPDKPAGGCLL